MKDLEIESAKKKKEFKVKLICGFQTPMCAFTQSYFFIRCLAF